MKLLHLSPLWRFTISKNFFLHLPWLKVKKSEPAQNFLYICPVSERHRTGIKFLLFACAQSDSASEFRTGLPVVTQIFQSSMVATVIISYDNGSTRPWFESKPLVLDGNFITARPLTDCSGFVLAATEGYHETYASWLEFFPKLKFALSDSCTGCKTCTEPIWSCKTWANLKSELAHQFSKLYCLMSIVRIHWDIKH